MVVTVGRKIVLTGDVSNRRSACAGLRFADPDAHTIPSDVLLYLTASFPASNLRRFLVRQKLPEPQRLAVSGA